MSMNTIAKLLIATGVLLIIVSFVLKALGIFSGVTIDDICKVGLTIMSPELLVAIGKNIDKFKDKKDDNKSNN